MKNRNHLAAAGRVALACAALLLGTASSPAFAQSSKKILVVGDSAGGTLSFVDESTLTRLGYVNAIPDVKERLAEMDIIRRATYEVAKATKGGDRFVDDIAVSLDGKTVFISRSNLSDVIAIDLSSPDHRILWRFPIPGINADHMGISPDGKHIAVSATSDGHFFVIDTATGKQVAKVPTGAFPHQNDYSPDGKYIYNSSLGIIPLPYALNALKGRKQMTVVDAQTFKVVNKWTLPYGIRPNVITRDGKITYLQMSYLNGYAKVDMATGKVLNKVEIPMSAYAKANFKTKDDFPLNSAFHGMAINGAESKLCMAGTIDNYIVVASVPSMTTDRIIPSGSKHYWASTRSDGTRCYVSNSESNDLSVVDFESATEVARIKVGQYPQRSRLANVPPAILDNLKH